jgi:hypothetical protein
MKQTGDGSHRLGNPWNAAVSVSSVFVLYDFERRGAIEKRLKLRVITGIISAL